MRIDDEFEAVEEVIPARTVTRLYRNGVQIRTPDGAPAEYASLEDAAYCARNKHVYFPGALIDLSDAQLRETAGRLSWLDRGRTLLHR